jgi:hypothetical protein
MKIYEISASLCKLLHELLVHGQLYGAPKVCPHRNVTQLTRTVESPLPVQTQKFSRQVNIRIV